MSFFGVYGPTYVEWLGELSCNVHFEDRYSAARALEAMSRALPLVPPQTDYSSTSAALSETNDESKLEAEPTNEEIKTDENDITSFAAAADTDMVVYDDQKDEMNADGETAGKTENNAENTNNIINATGTSTSAATLINLGDIGWRFCNSPIRKKQSDRFGKRGTRARCLMRVATSLDVLDERPKTWPKPPPGFTTKRVLGADDDFAKRNTNRRRRQQSDRNDGRGGGGGGGGKRSRHSNRGSRYEKDYYNEEDDNVYGNMYGEGREEDNNMQDENDHDNGGNSGNGYDEFGRSALDRGLNATR